jgi:hypothetical protein
MVWRAMSSTTSCMTCAGSGEMPTENGLVDCPDCGGAGRLPARAVVTAWRTSDLARTLAEQRLLEHKDSVWLLAELEKAQRALREIIALAHDIRDDEQLALRIRMVAGDAIGLYQLADSPPASAPAPD